MSNVTLEIAGRRYTIACAPGEEQHIQMLGSSISGKLEAVNAISGQSAERTLLYAALLLADELHESGKGGVQTPVSSDETLENLAEQLEALAERLESAAASA